MSVLLKFHKHAFDFFFFFGWRVNLLTCLITIRISMYPERPPYVRVQPVHVQRLKGFSYIKRGSRGPQEPIVDERGGGGECSAPACRFSGTQLKRIDGSNKFNAVSNHRGTNSSVTCCSPVYT